MNEQTIRTDIAYTLAYLAHISAINTNPVHQVEGGPTAVGQLEGLLADVLALVRRHHPEPLEAVTDALSFSRHTNLGWMVGAGRELVGDLEPVEA
jgi:hypothetical protein